jgi:hypothetical protein
MAAINEAWRVLGDPARRASYDASLSVARPAPVVPAPAGTGPGVAGSELDGEPEGRSFWAVALPWILVLVVLGGIFLFTAYARRGGSPDSPGSTVPVSPVDGVVEVGSCVVLDSGARTFEVSCAGPHTGIVSAVVPSGAPCPLQTEGFFSADGTRLVCITRD